MKWESIKAKEPARNSPRRLSDVSGLLQHRLVKLKPIVEVVEIHCVGGLAIGQAVGAEDGFAGVVVVLIAGHRGVVRGDRGGVDGFAVGLYPSLELRIGGLA